MERRLPASTTPTKKTAQPMERRLSSLRPARQTQKRPDLSKEVRPLSHRSTVILKYLPKPLPCEEDARLDRTKRHIQLI